MQYSTILLLSTLAITPYQISSFRRRHKRLVGGFSCKSTSYPFIVSITKNLEQTEESLTYISCGGVILSSHWIITAGTCINSEEIIQRKVVAIAGSDYEYPYIMSTKLENNDDIQIRNVTRGVRYEPMMYFDDRFNIGLMEVKPAFNIVKGKVEAAFLPSSFGWSENCVNVIALGWGQNTADDTEEANSETEEPEYQTHFPPPLSKDNLEEIPGVEFIYENNTDSSSSAKDEEVTNSDENDESIENFSYHLECANLKISPKNKCASLWPEYFNTTNQYNTTNLVFCTETSGYEHNQVRDICHGDQGGPIICNGIVIGIISEIYNSKCGVLEKAALHTKIDMYYHFLETTAGVELPFHSDPGLFGEAELRFKAEEHANNQSACLKINLLILLLIILLRFYK